MASVDGLPVLAIFQPASSVSVVSSAFALQLLRARGVALTQASTLCKVSVPTTSGISTAEIQLAVGRIPGLFASVGHQPDVVLGSDWYDAACRLCADITVEALSIPILDNTRSLRSQVLISNCKAVVVFDSRVPHSSLRKTFPASGILVEGLDTCTHVLSVGVHRETQTFPLTFRMEDGLPNSVDAVLGRDVYEIFVGLRARAHQELYDGDSLDTPGLRTGGHPRPEHLYSFSERTPTRASSDNVYPLGTSSRHSSGSVPIDLFTPQFPCTLKSHLLDIQSPYYIWELSTFNLCRCMHAHNIPVSGMDDEQCRQALVFHVMTGHCVNHSRSNTFGPSGCYQVGSSYESPRIQSFAALSFVLGECQEEVLAKYAVPFGVSASPSYRSTLLRIRDDMISQSLGTSLDPWVYLPAVYDLLRPALVSLCSSHGVVFADNASKETLIGDFLAHLVSGSCSDYSMLNIPAGCAATVMSVCGPGQDSSISTVEMQVANLILMGRKLGKTGLKKLCKVLRLEVPKDPSKRKLKVAIFQYAKKLRKAKNVPLKQSTSLPEERDIDVIANWPQRLTTVHKDRLMQQFDQMLLERGTENFCCCACAAVKPVTDRKIRCFSELDFDILRRPDKKNVSCEADDDSGMDVDEDNMDLEPDPEMQSQDPDLDHEPASPVSDSEFSADEEPSPSMDTTKTKQKKSKKPFVWLQPGYDIPSGTFRDVEELSNLLLEPSGVEIDPSGERKHRMSLCVNCNRRLSKGKLPPLALANGLYLGPVPRELTDLTLVEHNMIARCRTKAYILKLQGKGGEHQRGMKGHIIVYPQQPSAVINVLLPSLDELAKPICVLFVGSSPPSDEFLLKKATPLAIRPAKVRAALLWLIEHNPYYRGVTVNHALLDSLPDESVLPVHIEHSVTKTGRDFNSEGYDPVARAFEESSEPPVLEETQESSKEPVLETPRNPVDTVDTARTDPPIQFERLVIADVDPKASGAVLRAAALKHVKHMNGGYLQIPHDKDFVNEFHNSSLFPMMYPALFPYGLGGLSDDTRPERLSMERHIRHLFELKDKRFQEHSSFLFSTFNMIQRHSMLRKTGMKVKRAAFHKIAAQFADVSPTAVHAVSERIAKGDSVTAHNAEEKKVLKLMNEVKIVTSHVAGSAASKTYMRNEIRALMIEKGLPSFFVTINPADIHNPWVKVMAGGSFDVEQLLSRNIVSGSGWNQYQEIARNPFTGAKFFHHYMQAFVKGLLGFNGQNKESESGVLGLVNGYYGCVEAQGRGSLHCHMLVWVKGSLNPNELKNKLKTDEEFRRRLFEYLEDTIHNGIPESHSKGVDGGKNDEASSVNPCKLHRHRFREGDDILLYRQNRRDDVRALAEYCQIHEHTATCYKYHSKNKKKRCRFDLGDEFVRPQTTFDEETGEFELRRSEGLVANYNPTLLEALRCNTEIKFIGSGGTAKAILYYITDYITKSQLKAHIAFKTVDAAIQKLGSMDPEKDSPTSRAKKMLNRCAYALLGHQEMSGQQVASYLMEYGDHYTSHTFRPLFWTSFESFVDKILPSPECYLAPKPVVPANETEVAEAGEPTDGDPDPEKDVHPPLDFSGINDDRDECDEDDRRSPAEYVDLVDSLEAEEDTEQNAQYNEYCEDEDEVRIMAGRSREGVLVAQATQVSDYVNRGKVLHRLCLWDFVAQVDKVSKSKKRETLDCESDDEEDEEGHVGSGNEFEVELLNDTNRKRPSCPLLHPHIQAKTHKLVVRKPTRRMVPVPIGPALPRRDKEHTKEKHARMMLVLFKPWKIVADLRGPYPSWSLAFQNFQAECSSRVMSHMENMQLLHECRDSRDAHYDKRRAAWREKPGKFSGAVRDDSSDEAPTEEHLLEILQKIEGSTSERRARVLAEALECQKFATVAGMYRSHGSHAVSSIEDEAQDSDLIRVLGDEECNLEALWEDEYQERRIAWQSSWKQPEFPGGSAPVDEVQPTPLVQNGDAFRNARDRPSTELFLPENFVVVPPKDPDFVEPFAQMDELIAKYHLNKEQQRAFRIVAEHSLDSQERQLRMYLAGPGGTGKSTVINAISEFLKGRNQQSRMRLSSYTGVAARNIDGVTLHAALSLQQLAKGRIAVKTKEELRAKWEGVDYLVVDEVSMIGCAMMNDISEALCMAKGVNAPFGGINIIFAGDFAQLAPVGQRRLYSDVPTDQCATVNSQKQVFGKLLWHCIDTVVVLDEVCRSKDPKLTELLSRLRFGRCTDHDYQALLHRVPSRVKPHWSREWQGAPIIVAENIVKDALNERAALAFAQNTGKALHWYYSIDTIGGKLIQRPESHRLLESKSSAETSHLLTKIPLVIGMPVMITHNFDVQNGVVNGAIGTLKKVRYRQDESGRRYALSAVVHVPRSTGDPLTTLNPGEVVALPQDVTFTCENPFNPADRDDVRRCQLPVQPAFAITAHKSQGQTYERAVVDLASAHGTESAYVMVSRVTSLEGLIVLRPFQQKKITCRPSEDRRNEFARLEILRLQTIVERGHPEERTSAQKQLRQLLDNKVPLVVCDSDERVVQSASPSLRQARHRLKVLQEYAGDLGSAIDRKKTKPINKRRANLQAQCERPTKKRRK